MPTVVITGVSSGIGLELAKQLLARGDQVYGTVRSKAGSMTGVDFVSEVAGLKIIEGIDVTADDCAAKLQAGLQGIQVDVLIHNAGSVNGTRDLKGTEIFADQKLDNISMDRMRAAIEVNTLGPLRVQQALTAQMPPGSKVLVISTGMGSISDNGSGGLYAYRVSKAGANMVAKGLSCDLKEKQIAVLAIAPGMVVSEFGAGSEAMAKMGAKPVAQAGSGIVQAIDELSLESTGKFMVVASDDGKLKEMPW